MAELLAEPYPIEPQRKPGTFTAETARLAALKSAQVRQAKASAEPEPFLTAPIPAQADDYLAKRLSRVRGQIERLSVLLDEEDEPQKLDRLSAALDRLSKLEFAYSNRPMPGTWKPAPQAKERRTDAESSLPEPTPVVVSAPQ